MPTSLLFRSLSFVCVLAMGSTFVCPPEVAAQPATEDREGQARRLYASGVRAFEERRFEEALRYFQGAYDLSQRAALLYNIGRAAEEAGRRADAVAAYDQYLASNPTERRDEVGHRLETLRSQPQGDPVRTDTNTDGTDETDGADSATERTIRREGEVEPQGGSIVEEPVFWIAVGGGAIAVAAVVLIVVLTSGSSDPAVAALSSSDPIPMAGIGIGGRF